MEDKRFVIIKKRDNISVLDTKTQLELFGLMFEDNDVFGNIIEIELNTIVRVLNEQDRLLKQVNISVP